MQCLCDTQLANLVSSVRSWVKGLLWVVLWTQSSRPLGSVQQTYGSYYGFSRPTGQREVQTDRYLTQAFCRYLSAWWLIVLYGRSHISIVFSAIPSARSVSRTGRFPHVNRPVPSHVPARSVPCTGPFRPVYYGPFRPFTGPFRPIPSHVLARSLP